MSQSHIERVLVLTVVEAGADTIAKICDQLEGSWAQVEGIVDELVGLGKLSRERDTVRRVTAEGVA